MKMAHARAALIAVALTAPHAAAALSDYADDGPYAAGWRDEVLPFVGAQTITNRVYYPAVTAGADAPADASGGPYPLVGFIHGQGSNPDFYETYSAHIASHGYVVASLGGMSQQQESLANMAKELRELIDWLEVESADVTSPYAGLVWDEGVAVIGHSKGGSAAQVFLGLEPPPRAAMLLEPAYVINSVALANLAAWDGAALFVAGDQDAINPPAEVKNIVDAASGATRRVYVEMLGAGHFGPFDADIPGLGGDPLPHVTQLTLHGALTVAFLEAELLDDEDAFHALIGGGASGEPLVHESSCDSPPLWVVEQVAPAKTISFGVAGTAGDLALIAVSPNPASIPTPNGLLLIDPASATILAGVALGTQGTHEVVAPVPASASGLVFHVQGLVLNATGTLTRGDVTIVP